MFRPSTLSLFVLGLTAPLLSAPDAQAQAPVQAAPASAVPTLMPGAGLRLLVMGAPDLTGDYVVDRAGNITLLYIGAVHVAGLTPSQVAAYLSSKDCLGKYYRRPQVLVTQTSAGGLAVEVTGAVTNQGSRVMRSDSRLNDLLQPAGPAVDADLAHVRVTHGLPDTPHATDTIDYRSFLNSQSAAGNPALVDGDVIFVPRKQSVPISVLLRGEVAKPGSLSLPAGSTALDALQGAGGPLNDADRAGIILRRADGSGAAPINYDTASLRPSDPVANPLLRDGDALSVAASATPGTYFLTGAVLKPSEYPLDRPGLTLADALGRAGGLEPYAKKKEVTLLRRTASGSRIALKLDVSDPGAAALTALQPGDIVSVPQGSPGTHFNPLQAVGVYSTLSRLLGR